jgi:hypothetical protein
MNDLSFREKLFLKTNEKEKLEDARGKESKNFKNLDHLQQNKQPRQSQLNRYEITKQTIQSLNASPKGNRSVAAKNAPLIRPTDSLAETLETIQSTNKRKSVKGRRASIRFDTALLPAPSSDLLKDPREFSIFETHLEESLSVEKR